MATSIRVDFSVPMKMRDGVTLRADVFRPDDNEKHPAIIVRIPYSKNYSPAIIFRRIMSPLAHLPQFAVKF